MTSISIIRPDDWHTHLRDDASLALTVPDAARYFGRSIVMPNLVTPVSNTQLAVKYRDRILRYRPEESSWQPLMALYLTDNTDSKDMAAGYADGALAACKLYPAGATTNSDSGVTDLSYLNAVFESMQDSGMPLLIHGEVTDTDIDLFDREAVFIDRHLTPLVKNFPELKIVFEHITTKEAVDFVTEGPDTLAATITAHHMLFNRNHMLAGGIRPHYYCLPILKRNSHQNALIHAATNSRNTKFFLGTDSAPHAVGKKEVDCGCAGCYTGHAALELYTEAFEKANALDKLESFASLNGPAFYGLQANSDKIELVKTDWEVEDSFALGNDRLKPIRAGERISWTVL
jgi:dihydroorotase